MSGVTYQKTAQCAASASCSPVLYCMLFAHLKNHCTPHTSHPLLQLRSMSEVERRILSSTAPGGTAGAAAATGQQAQTGSSTPKPQAAGALLFVSGSHPVRSLPGVSRWVRVWARTDRAFNRVKRKK